jgi:V-type H+-transporting ATPase subunit a
VTFPFLFAVMFGDYGHGSLLFVVGIFLVLMNDKLKNTAAAEACRLRYMLTMMGFFSMYNGLLYNEFFAIPNDWFGSCFETSVRTCTTTMTNPSACNAVYWPKGCIPDP